MQITRTCPKCGAEITGEALGGLCPNCVAVLAFAAEADPLKNAAESAPVRENSGDFIDRYKLLEKLGEGGCGVVYMAEQEEPVRRRVALKVIKLGMDTKNVIARFEAERQALALMDHPNIAKVFDAGATDTGRPFFVMELVCGTRITDYCDANQLSTRQRLDLFVQVCQAIQHAHQKGLIHRDIKPSNILVTWRDGVPVPKVIDFGIAKATTDQVLTDKTIFTEFQQFIGTPAYMSPEQAEMSELGVDTRSDIYSLGILLYELLTGKTPFEVQRILRAGLDEIRRIIREEEPLRPSTRLETLNKEEQTTAAKDRQSEPPKLIGLIRGDLDLIVMKCLEKDRRRRYETANGLAADIERHLKNEPVVASPPSKLYRLEKLVRRNKLAFAAGSAIAAALVLGLGLSIWLLVREKEAREQAALTLRTAQRALDNESRFRRQAQTNEMTARKEAAKSQKVAQFLKDVLDIGPSAAVGRDTTMLQEILARATESFEWELKDHREVVAELRAIVAHTYLDLGISAEAQPLDRRATDARSVKIKNYLAWRLATDPDPRQRNGSNALIYAEQAVTATGRTNHAVLDTLAAAYAETGRFTNAVAVEREAMALLRKVEQKEDYASRLRLYEGGNAYYDDDVLAERTRALLDAGKFAAAEALARECLIFCEKRIPNDWRAFNARCMLGGSLLGQKKFSGDTELLLLSGYNGLKEREGTIPPASRQRLVEALERLVQLYEETNRPNRAAEWKEKLTRFERAAM